MSFRRRKYFKAGGIKIFIYKRLLRHCPILGALEKKFCADLGAKLDHFNFWALVTTFYYLLKTLKCQGSILTPLTADWRRLSGAMRHNKPFLALEIISLKGH